jgi:hypothetical protein
MMGNGRGHVVSHNVREAQAQRNGIRCAGEIPGWAKLVMQAGLGGQSRQAQKQSGLRDISVYAS